MRRFFEDEEGVLAGEVVWLDLSTTRGELPGVAKCACWEETDTGLGNTELGDRLPMLLKLVENSLLRTSEKLCGETGRAAGWGDGWSGGRNEELEFSTQSGGVRRPRAAGSDCRGS